MPRAGEASKVDTIISKVDIVVKREEHMIVREGQRIVAFYEEKAPDDRGRFLDDILRFSDAELESVHDFIQWLFPLRERSGANPDAPRLDDEAVYQFHRRIDLQENMVRSLDRMLAFYGFAREGERIFKTPAFAQHAQWLTPGNHNHLRLTRILKSLTGVGHDTLAQSFFRALHDVYDEERRNGRNAISETTFSFWQNALRA
jgi:hypothetical protein